jgi:NAD(P)-dependent dehydrogenase (short-subunit alcohol dehydrogenase family)
MNSTRNIAYNGRPLAVTGSNRGIGLELVKAIAKNPSNIVYAGTRNPAQATELVALAKENDRVKIVKWDVSSQEAHQAAAELVNNEVGKVDVILANAGKPDL